MKLKKKMKLKDIPKEDMWYIVDLLSVFCGKEMGINRRRKKENNCPIEHIGKQSDQLARKFIREII